MKTTESRAAFLACIIALHRATPSTYEGANPTRDAVYISRVVGKLQAYTRNALSVETARCNYPTTEKQDERRLATMAKRETELHAMLAELGATNMRVRLGGDPRGNCGVLLVDGLRGDGWGDGFGVYA